MNNQQIDKMTAKDVPAGKLKPEQVAGWLQEIDSAKGREKEWRQEAQSFVKAYEGYKREATPFNILYSNTDTLLPALYNNTPRPAVGRRHKDKDPLAAAVALTLNRTLSYSMDPNDGAVAGFDELIGHAILQALVPGRGVTRYKYKADITEPTAQKKKGPGDTPAEGEEGQNLEEELPEVKNEQVVGEAVEYDRFLNGFARRWKQVPWVSFEHHMTKEELERNFGAIGKQVTVSAMEEDATEEDKASKDNRKIAVVYEVWDKATKSVFFISPGMKEAELKHAPDPLGVTGFYPMPEPLHFLGKISSMVPQPVYNLYRKQAEELNTITNRITAVIDALKVRGAYASEMSELAEILKQDDNGMVAVTNIQVLGDGKTLKDALFFMPLGELTACLQQLYLQRTQIKQVIYEITGISDILRGSSVASETATAQQIKNQWGTLRLKAMQKKVANYCRQSLRIIGEIASRKFSQETFQAMTGLPYITAEQKQIAEMEMEQFQQQATQQPPAEGSPPPQPPQQLIDTLATPVWEEIVALMRNALDVSYRVDIETNSTIADDMAEDQKNIGELLNALSQFLNGVSPLIEKGIMPFEVAKTMMLGIVRKMAMGPEIEDQLEKMKEPPPPPAPEAAAPPPPPPVDPNIELKAQAEKARLEGDMEKHRMAMETAQMEMAQRRQEHENKMAELAQKKQVSDAKFQQQLLSTQQKAAQPAPVGA